jgi:hypothetical protein
MKQKIHGEQPGNSAKEVAAKIQVVESADSPLRLVLGENVVNGITQKLDESRSIDTAFEKVAIVTGASRGIGQVTAIRPNKVFIITALMETLGENICVNVEIKD